jgi:hypothetical protein
MRNWSLIRTLHWPARSPFNASNRFPGGARMSSTCVRDRGLRAVKDWELMGVKIQGDHTLVTLNSIDFRGRGAASPGGLYAKQEIHAGPICFGAEAPIDLDDQRELTSAALEILLQHEDLINRVLARLLATDREIRRASAATCPLGKRGYVCTFAPTRARSYRLFSATSRRTAERSRARTRVTAPNVHNL